VKHPWGRGEGDGLLPGPNRGNKGVSLKDHFLRIVEPNVVRSTLGEGESILYK